MITVFVHNLSEKKVDEIKKAITSFGARIVDQGIDYEVSFECDNNNTKKLVCKEITRIKEKE